MTQRSGWWTVLGLLVAGGVACNDDPSASDYRSAESSALPGERDAATSGDAEPAEAEPADAGDTEPADEPDAGEQGADAGAPEPDGGDPSTVDGGDPDGGSDPDAGSDAGAEPPADIAIAGRWHSNYGGVESISSSAWVSYGSVAVVRYDNARRVAILQNPQDDAFSPNTFSKVVWTEPTSGGFYYCTIAFGKDSADEADGVTDVADPSAPELGGCGGFSWTKLSPPLEIEGRWRSNFGGSTGIDSDRWGSQTVVRYDNTANEAVTRSASGKLSRQVWTEPSGGAFFQCTIDFGLDSIEAVEASTKLADATDPASGGCGAFPWTAYTATPELEIAGDYVVAGSALAISSDRWGERRIARYDNSADSAVVQSADGATFDALVWTRGDGVLYVCTTASGQASADAAASAAITPRASDLTAGCGGSAWTRLDDAP